MFSIDSNDRPSSDQKFYSVGGTLPDDAPSYVRRKADDDLFHWLKEGHFCYALTPRQMGKSSLITRTAVRLRLEGIAVVTIDLTALGQNLGPEQWYHGMLQAIGRQLNLEDPLVKFWNAHRNVSSLQRWTGAIRQVVLPFIRASSQVTQVPAPHDVLTVTSELPVSGNEAPSLVIFVDEIDTVRSLNFRTDEFFAAIREVYNRRAQDPLLNCLTFCLMGVATPADLIQDSHTTPFNIGKGIELTDFTEKEAAPLSSGLGGDQHSKSLLKQVLSWTGGHPYLTQCLCHAVAIDSGSSAPRDVDRICSDLFLTSGVSLKDNNLLFVRDQLLRSSVDRAALVEMYSRVLRRRIVYNSPTDEVIGVLRLSGIVRVSGNRLYPRNQIYSRVFDQKWIKDQLPDAERRRLKAAYRRGLILAGSLSGVVVSLLCGLSALALFQAQRAHEGELAARQYLYVANLNLAEDALEEGNPEGALKLLEAERPEPGELDLRGFEWRRLWRCCTCRRRVILRGLPGSILSISLTEHLLAAANTNGAIKVWNTVTGSEVSPPDLAKLNATRVAFSPDGKVLAIGLRGGDVKLWDVVAGRPMKILHGGGYNTTSLLFSWSGKLVAAADTGHTIRIWQVDSQREIRKLVDPDPAARSLVISPEEQVLSAGGLDGSARMWNIATGRQKVMFHEATLDGSGAALSPDGRTLAVAITHHTARLWDITQHRKLATVSAYHLDELSLAFSPSGDRLAMESSSGLSLWNTRTRRFDTWLPGPNYHSVCPAFSPDGRSLASARMDGAIEVWDMTSRDDLPPCTGQKGPIYAIAFSPNSRILAAGSQDGSVRLWNTATGRALVSLTGHGGAIHSLAFSPDGFTLATASNDRVIQLWDVSAKCQKAALRGPAAPIRCLAYSPGGAILAGASEDGKITLWNANTLQIIGTLRRPGTAIHSLAFSPDGSQLVAGEANNSAIVWDISGQRQITCLTGHLGLVSSAAFAPDGRSLALGSQDGTVSLWNTGQWNKFRVLDVHGGPVNSIAFAPDGKSLVTGSEDGDTRLWNTATGQEVGRLKGRPSTVDTVAFSPDGLNLAAGSADGATIIWKAASFHQADSPL